MIGVTSVHRPLFNPRHVGLQRKIPGASGGSPEPPRFAEGGWVEVTGSTIDRLRLAGWGPPASVPGAGNSGKGEVLAHPVHGRT